MHPGAKVAGRYLIEEVISSQGMGSIYKARDVHGNTVAIKSLQPEAVGKRERFSREMQTLQELEHPAIVRYLDSGTDEAGTPYFVMEWLEGQDLASRLRAQPLTLGETLVWAGRIAEALGVVHSRGVVHRDVKPSNIFLPSCEVGTAKLIDFGIAYIAGASTQLTATGMMMGTPAYMAPEQARGERIVDARVDVFSLGCVIYESLVGVPAFMGSTPMAVLGKILVEPSPRLRDTIDEIPELIDTLVARMMTKERDGRPSSGSEIAAEIERIVAILGDDSQQHLHRHHQKPSVLTRDERRWISAVVVAAAPAILGSNPALTAPTMQLDAGRRVHSPLEKLGGTVFERLADGSLVNIVEVRGAATDQAASAASLALVFRKEFPDRHVAIATGRAIRREGRMASDVIDRAAEILRSIHRPLLARPDMVSNAAVWVDELTAELLDGRFEIHQDTVGIMLSGRRRTLEERCLLGRTTPFVGRRREFSALIASLEECVEESVAQAVLVTGPPGCGKSRLMHELLRYLDNHAGDVIVWVGDGEPMHEGSPLFSMADALRRALDMHEGTPMHLRRGALHALAAQAMRPDSRPDSRPDIRPDIRPEVPEKLERVVEFLSELVDLPVDEPSLSLRAARQDPRLMGDQIQRACEELIQGLCTRKPLVLVIDDLQWSDRATVSLLDRMLRNLAESPFMVIAFGRPVVHERFPRIWADRSITELRLGPITKRAAEKLTRSMLGHDADDKLVRALVQRAGGNAFYLEELLRSALSGHSEWPESVLAMVEMRIESLEVQARQTLRAASVFGSGFWRGGVHHLLGNDDVDDWLDRLVERELIIDSRTSRFAGEREYRFRHALVREGAYAMLTDEDRQLGHRLAAEWLESVAEDDPRVIAEQFERGHSLDRALPYFARAAEDAFERSDLDAVLTLAERAGSCGATGEQLGKLRYMQGSVHVWQGHYRAAAPLFSEAMELLPENSRGWYDAAGAAADAWSRLADVERVAAVAARLTANAQTPDERTRLGRNIAMTRLAQSLFEVGPRELAVSLLSDVRAKVGMEPDDPLLAAYLHYASARYYIEVVGDPAHALHEFNAVLANFEIVGDERQACMQRTNVGYMKLELGLYDEAEGELREAMNTAQRLGLAEPLHNATRLLGMAYSRSKKDSFDQSTRLAEAVQMERDAAAWFEERDNEATVAWIQVVLANMLLAQGDHEAALELVRAAQDVSWTAVAATAMLSRIALLRGEPALALSAAEDAMTMYQSPDRSEEDTALVYLVYAKALRANGRMDESRALITEARDEMLARADKIGNPAWRESFLSSIPDHASLLELYDAWCGRKAKTDG